MKKDIDLLIVEDNVTDQMLYENILKNSNQKSDDYSFQTEFVSTIQDMKRSVSTKYYDLVLCDLNLVDSQSNETLKELENIKLKSPIVVISELKRSEIINNAKSYPFLDYIEKGEIRVNNFAERLVFCLDKNKQEVNLKRSFFYEQIKLMNEGIVHEINDSLTKMLFQLREDEIDNKYSKYINKIKDSIQKLMLSSRLKLSKKGRISKDSYLDLLNSSIVNLKDVASDNFEIHIDEEVLQFILDVIIKLQVKNKHRKLFCVLQDKDNFLQALFKFQGDLKSTEIDLIDEYSEMMLKGAMTLIGGKIKFLKDSSFVLGFPISYDKADSIKNPKSEDTINRILYVEDQEDISNIVKDFLEEEGFEVETASNGYFALNLIKAKKYDLIISDSEMPIMSGYELYKELQKREINIPFIFVTGFSKDLNLLSRQDSEEIKIIDKPFELDDLLHHIEEIKD